MHVSSKYNLELLSSRALSIVGCFKNKNSKTTINTVNKMNLILFSGEKKKKEGRHLTSLACKTELLQSLAFAHLMSTNE